MKVIDLTHTISENMPVYPGTETPKLKVANTYEKDGFNWKGEILSASISGRWIALIILGSIPKIITPWRITIDDIFWNQ